MEEKGENKEGGYRGYTNQVYRRSIRIATIERVDTKANESMALPRKEWGDNKESGYRGCTKQGYRSGRRRATIKRASTEAIQIKGTEEGEEGTIKRVDAERLDKSSLPRREEQGDNK